MALLVEVQLDVLFARDARGRLVATRDPLRRAAPRVFLGRSPEGNAWRVRADVEPEVRGELERLLSAEPALEVAAHEHAAWARAIQRRGLVALYSTSWENAASRALARRLSARVYGEDWHVT